MLLDNVRDFALMPISLVAALIDLISEASAKARSSTRCSRWGSHSEKVIDVYSAIEHHEKGDFKISPRLYGGWRDRAAGGRSGARV